MFVVVIFIIFVKTAIVDIFMRTMYEVAVCSHTSNTAGEAAVATRLLIILSYYLLEATLVNILASLCVNNVTKWTGLLLETILQRIIS